MKLKLGRWSQTTRVVVAPDIPVSVLLGTNIRDLSLSNPMMVTTRAQAKRDSNLMTDTEDTSQERPSELDSLEITEDISATDAANGEYSQPTEEVEAVEQI